MTCLRPGNCWRHRAKMVKTSLFIFTCIIMSLLLPSFVRKVHRLLSVVELGSNSRTRLTKAALGTRMTTVISDERTLRDATGDGRMEVKLNVPAKKNGFWFGTDNLTPIAGTQQTLPTAYIITPTYARPTQRPDLTRLCNTLMHVPRARWLVVEDSDNRTSTVTALLAACRAPGLTITHLAARTPNKTPHRGVAQRNAALSWIHHNVHPAPDGGGGCGGGVYCADDDNTYDVRLFEAVRRAQTVSVWIVGFAGDAKYAGPICSAGKVTGWQGYWLGNRTYPLDMAGFAVGLNFLLTEKSHVRFHSEWESGHLEDQYLLSLVGRNPDLMQAPGTDPNCTQVLVWHTKTNTPVYSPVVILRKKVLDV